MCDNDKKEEWRVSKDFPKYAVSSLGKVVNIKTKKILKGSKTKEGYWNINLRGEDNKSHMKRLHRFILETFDPIEGSNKLTVNHKDEDKDNNSVENLEWLTSIENVRYGTGIQRRLESFNKTIKERGGCYPVPVDVYQDKEQTILIGSFESVAAAANSGLNSYKNIYRAINRENHFSKNYYYVRHGDNS